VQFVFEATGAGTVETIGGQEEVIEDVAITMSRARAPSDVAG
jgi:hypothetical protein